MTPSRKTEKAAAAVEKTLTDLKAEDCSQCAELKALINEMLSALNLCLDSGGLSWEAEQEADAVCKKAERLGFKTGKNT